VPGNTHSADIHGEWTTVTRNDRKNDSKSSDASATGTSTAKKGRMDSGLIVYLKSRILTLLRRPVDIHWSYVVDSPSLQVL